MRASAEQESSFQRRTNNFILVDFNVVGKKRNSRC